MQPTLGTHNTYSKLAILSVPPPLPPPPKQRFFDSSHNYNVTIHSLNNYHTLLGRLSHILECNQLVSALGVIGVCVLAIARTSILPSEANPYAFS